MVFSSSYVGMRFQIQYQIITHPSTAPAQKTTNEFEVFFLEKVKQLTLFELLFNWIHANVFSLKGKSKNGRSLWDKSTDVHE